MDGESRVARKKRRTVVLVDDVPAIREALARVIARSDQLELVGQAGDYRSALELLEAAHPDIAVVDRSMPGGDPTRGFERLRAAFPATALVLLTATPLADVEPSLLLTVHACLDKCRPLSEAVASLEAVVLPGGRPVLA